MVLGFGENFHRSVEELILKDPNYVAWMLEQHHPSDQMAKACDEARRLIEIFNRKPFVRTCSGSDCTRPATRCTVYGQNVTPMYWCDECDPYSAGAGRDKLAEIHTFSHVVQHVRFLCNERRSAMEHLIRALARAKGAPKRVGADQAWAFFHSEAAVQRPAGFGQVLRVARKGAIFAAGTGRFGNRHGIAHPFALF